MTFCEQTAADDDAFQASGMLGSTVEFGCDLMSTATTPASEAVARQFLFVDGGPLLRAVHMQIRGGLEIAQKRLTCWRPWWITYCPSILPFPQALPLMPWCSWGF
jgi:hypothetical protein